MKIPFFLSLQQFAKEIWPQVSLLGLYEANEFTIFKYGLKHFGWMRLLYEEDHWFYKFTLVRASMHGSVRAFGSYSLERSIFFSNFLHELVSPYDLDNHQRFFGRKICWPPKWPKMVKIWPFLAKIAIF